jgi:hypothetical protein
MYKEITISLSHGGSLPYGVMVPESIQDSGTRAREIADGR